MKDFIVVIALIGLGIFIFTLLMNDDDSVKSATKGLMEAQLGALSD